MSSCKDGDGMGWATIRVYDNLRHDGTGRVVVGTAYASGTR